MFFQLISFNTIHSLSILYKGKAGIQIAGDIRECRLQPSQWIPAGLFPDFIGPDTGF
jgi:hypothetical protein